MIGLSENSTSNKKFKINNPSNPIKVNIITCIKYLISADSETPTHTSEETWA